MYCRCWRALRLLDRATYILMFCAALQINQSLLWPLALALAHRSLMERLDIERHADTNDYTNIHMGNSSNTEQRG